MRKIATIGMFDGVHRGHVHLLNTLRDIAAEQTMSPIAISFPEHPLSIISPDKVPDLLCTAEEKETIFRNRFPDIELIMLPFSERIRNMSAKEFLQVLQKKFGISAILTGFNNHLGADRKSGNDLKGIGERIGTEIIICSELPDESASSTLIRKALEENNPKIANRLLGYEYSISGVVCPGKKLGRKLGFPTANIVPEKNKLIPEDGCYICMAETDGKEYPAMVNIGHCPTLDSPVLSPESIEAHLIGVSRNFDIYGKKLTLRFFSFLRKERKFDSVEELKNQLISDRETTVRFFSEK